MEEISAPQKEGFLGELSKLYRSSVDDIAFTASVGDFYAGQEEVHHVDAFVFDKGDANTKPPVNNFYFKMADILPAIANAISKHILAGGDDVVSIFAEKMFGDILMGNLNEDDIRRIMTIAVEIGNQRPDLIPLIEIARRMIVPGVPVSLEDQARFSRGLIENLGVIADVICQGMASGELLEGIDECDIPGASKIVFDILNATVLMASE